MPTSAFLRQVMQNDTTAATHPHRRYLYYSGEIERLGDWALRDIEPYRELLRLRPERSSINTWIGQPGVTAHCHYDGYHNFFVQIQGRKAFKIFPPSEWRRLYVHSFLHPSHAQCQVNLSHVDEAAFPGSSDTPFLLAVLQPGDLLYLPPLWFHEVTAVGVQAVRAWLRTSRLFSRSHDRASSFPVLRHLHGPHPASRLLRPGHDRLSAGRRERLRQCVD